MIPEILEIENGQVVININCLTIPELKMLHDKYTDPIPAFTFLYHKYSPKGPYSNAPEEEKDEILIHDFPGEYTLEDPEMIAAIQKMDSFHVTATYQYYLDHKLLLEKLGRFARTAPITTGRDGSINALAMQVRNVGKTISEFKVLEKTVLQELAEMGGRTRGNRKLAYDQE
jgi:hypothetical protein